VSIAARISDATSALRSPPKNSAGASPALAGGQPARFEWRAVSHDGFGGAEASGIAAVEGAIGSARRLPFAEVEEIDKATRRARAVRKIIRARQR
jgi:hypothetical protein